VSSLDTITLTKPFDRCLEHIETYGRLRKISDPDEWRRSASLPNGPAGGDGPDHEDTRDGLMSFGEWLQIQNSEPYYAYNKEHVATMNPKLLRTSHTLLSDRLAVALMRCHRLTSFTHNPPELAQKSWLTRWRRWRSETKFKGEPESMHEGVPFLDEACVEDEDAGALHLAYALRALAQAKTTLTSLTFHVEVQAFWGAHRLRRLWSDGGHGEIRRLRKIHWNANEADQQASNGLDDDISEYEAQLVAMQDVFENLTQLDCWVSDNEESGGLLAASKPMAQFLCRASMLRRLDLAFGEFLFSGHTAPAE
jgi:hypothetical protein